MKTRIPGENETTLLRHYEIADICGNIRSCTQIIHVRDVKTSVSGAGDIEIECISEVPEAYNNIDQYIDAGAVINTACEIDPATFKLEKEQSDFNICPTIITRTYSFETKCGDVLTKDQKIIIMDKTKPVFVNKPGDLVEYCKVPDPYVNISQFRSAGGEIVDNCKLDENSFALVSEASNGKDCYMQYARIYSISDICGNVEYYSQNIIVSDTEAPRFGTNLQEMTVACEIPARWNSLSEFVAAGGSVSDNCGMNNNSFAFLEEEISGDQCPIEVIRTYAVSDNCGNVSTFKNKITVIDTEYPALETPENIRIPDGEAVPEAFRNYNEFVANGGSASDNCMINESSFKLKIENIVYYNLVDSVIRQYEISDYCSNTSYAEHIIIIERDSIPFIASPPDMIFSCRSELPSPYQTFEEFEAAGGRGKTNCSFVTSTFRMSSETRSSGSCPEIVTRIYEMTDDCGMIARTTHRIIINDQYLPVISGKEEIDVVNISDIPSVYSDFAAFIADGGTASDNCGLREETFMLKSEQSQLENCPFTVTRIYAIADSCGNEGKFTQTIIIGDHELPKITAPKDSDIDCLDAIPSAFNNYAEFISAGGYVTDNTFVDETSFTLTKEDTTIQNGIRQIIRTYQIADECGNIGTASHIIQSIDDVAPVATCNPIMISLDINGKYELTNDDILQITLGSHDDCTPIAGLKYQVSPSVFDCSMLGDMKDLQVTVTDAYGNSSNCQTTAIVLDNYIPEISCTNINLYLDENGHANLSPEMVATIESENCDNVTLTIDQSEFICSDAGEHKITVIAKDQTNVATCSATVTVLDTIAPRFIHETVDLVIDDSEKAILTNEILSSLAHDACGISSFEPDKTEFTCADIGENTVHLKITDFYNNSSETDLLVNVIAGNLSPQAFNDTIATIRDVPIVFNVSINDKDPDGSIDVSSLNITHLPVHGSISINSDTKEVTYTPDNGFVGADQMEYVICDDGIPCLTLCDTATVFISVLKPNIAPVAVDDNYTSGCDMIIENVLSNDYDVDGHAIKAETSLVSKPEFGIVTMHENGDFTYEFATGFSGNDSFIYQICDNALDSKCSQATVYINIFADNDCDDVDDVTDIDDDNDGILDVLEGDGAIDTDNDGFPDSKDIDSDNDGILDNTEAQEEGKFIPLSGVDENGDGLDDAFNIDNLETKNSEITGNEESGNINSKNATAGGLTPVDTDTDGIPDYIDKDSDNDHVLDYIEAYDEAAHGIPSIKPYDIDDDKDGLDNAYDNIVARMSDSDFTNPIGCNEVLQDFDRDGIRDWRDPNDDNDGIKTKFEDLNNDGIYANDDLDMDGHPEYLDVNSDCSLFIPEGFSPDGDGVHDYFQIYCIDSYPNARLMIFDRLGNQVYSKEHYGNIEFWGSYEDSWWNGIATMGPNVNKKVSPEIYLYIFEFGNGKSQRGFVMVSY